MQIYRSKIGMVVWLPIILVTLFTGVFLINDSNSWIAMLIIALTGGFVIFNVFSIRYIINEEHLTVNGSFTYKKTIPIKDIRKIKETNNPLAAPAGSMDRLEIRYNKSDSVIISPKNKMQFINTLVAKNPDIEVVFSKKRSTRKPIEPRR